MADSNGGGSYRGGGRKGNYRGPPYHIKHPSNTSKDQGRERGGDRDRSRQQDRRERKPEGGDRRERHRSDDRDKVHKPRNNGPPNKSGLGYNSTPNRPSSSGKGSANPPTGPKAHFEPARDKSKPSLPVEEEEDIDMEGLDEEEREDKMIKKLMGFSKFKTTKNTKIPGNEFNYGVRKEKVTKYRQYMNRTGGFNRPLSPAR